MKKTVVIEAPFNLGLKAVVATKAPGVDKLPAWLQQHGFYRAIGANRVATLAAPEYQIKMDTVSGVLNTPEIIAYSRQLSKLVKTSLDAGEFPVVIGGDCSILLGCAHALKLNGRYGLFFIDGHTDYIPAALSATKAAAGMDLALATGLGHPLLTNIDGLRPYIQASDVFAFGNRYDDPEYVQTIKNSAITYHDLETIRIKGVDAITGDFIQLLEKNKLDGCWIHLDVDVLDDELMPCVDSRQPAGLTYPELKNTLSNLLNTGLVAGLNITILDPDLDPDGRYVTTFIAEIAGLLN